MEKLLTAEELADRLGVKLSTIYKWTHEGRIPRVQNIRLLRFREKDIEAWLSTPEKKAHKQEPFSPQKAPTRKKTRSCRANDIDALVNMIRDEVLS